MNTYRYQSHLYLFFTQYREALRDQRLERAGEISPTQGSYFLDKMPWFQEKVMAVK